MDFTGKGHPLTRKGLDTVLVRIGLDPGDEACIWTVIEVETAGVTQGFGFRQDRRPQILFERHKFREFTGGRFDQEAPDISGPAGGYGTLILQYERLEKAISLCERDGLDIEHALRAASWGLGQVMGFNHSDAGFASATEMAEAMKIGEDEQIAAMAGFLSVNKLADVLKKKNWTAFAKRYNGRNYWKNKYDVKLAEQFQRFASGSLPNLEIRAAQVALLYLGYSPGKIDGVLGQRTRGALRDFRIANNLPASDDLDSETYNVLCQKATMGS
jgi:hypothetical protein